VVRLWMTWLCWVIGCGSDQPTEKPVQTPVPPQKVGEPISIDLDAAPNIVLITIDTLRADHLELYGYGRETSPSLSALATEGVTFMDAIAPAPWTLPTLASIHSSLYPSENFVVGARSRLNDSVETLAETLRRAGYRTIGVVSNRFASTDYGMHQGFEIFDDSQIVDHDGVSSAGLTRVAVEKLGRGHAAPTFLWVHYFDPHFSLVRHPKVGFADGYTGQFGDPMSNADVVAAMAKGGVSEADIDYAKNVYDEEIAFTDKWVGALLSSSALQGERKQVTIVTSDHGEYFMERGRFFHGEDVYRELVHVPLIIAGDIEPALRGTKVSETVGLSSIATTIMTRLGIEEHPFHGVDLLGPVEALVATPVFAEGGHWWGRGNKNKAVVTPNWKLIHTPNTDAYELYDRVADPAERVNRYGDELPPEVQALQATLAAFPTHVGEAAEEVETTPETLRQLEALGYVE
jgi:arylsulfatase A-like enzyme